MGYVRTQRALAGEAAARAKAEANAQLAVEALDRIFEQIYPVRTSVRAEPVLAGMPGELVDIPSVPILPKETAALLEEILPFYDRLAQQTGNSADLRLRTAEANRRVGNIRQRLGHTKEAVQAYQRAITIFQELGSRSSATFDLNLKLAQSYNELGRIFTAQRQFSHALESHEAARSLLQPADAPSVSPLLRFELARTYFFLGLRERPLPKTEARDDRGPGPGPGEQRTNLIQAVTLLKELSGKSPGNPEYQHLLALCYLEGAPMGNERRAAARGGNEQAIALLESLVSAYPGSADYAYDLSEAYARMHIPRPPVAPDLETQIDERLGKALALLEGLVTKHPEAPEFLAFEARVYHKRGSFYQQVGHWPEAEHSFRSAIACQQRLLAQFPDVQPYIAWMTAYRFSLADALFRQDQPTAARTEIEETIAALRTQLEQNPDLNSLHELLASSYTQLEKLLRKTGERAEAEAAARKAKAEREMVLRSD
jgi:tetratricopeptide (TPR) repeat protein